VLLGLLSENPSQLEHHRGPRLLGRGSRMRSIAMRHHDDRPRHRAGQRAGHVLDRSGSVDRLGLSLAALDLEAGAAQRPGHVVGDLRIGLRAGRPIGILGGQRLHRAVCGIAVERVGHQRGVQRARLVAE
jgi:hypothetical protein